MLGFSNDWIKRYSSTNNKDEREECRKENMSCLRDDMTLDNDILIHYISYIYYILDNRWHDMTFGKDILIHHISYLITNYAKYVVFKIIIRFIYHFIIIVPYLYSSCNYLFSSMQILSILTSHLWIKCIRTLYYIKVSCRHNVLKSNKKNHIRIKN